MGAMRAAVYARFSSDLQRSTSLDDQIGVARAFAVSHGWSLADDHVYTDAAISGASMERPGVIGLLAAAAVRPRPFDVVLVDDSSRVARDLADAVRFMQQLKFLGVRVIFISQSIDSDSEQAEVLTAVHGIVDSLYLKELGKKVKRGLAGQIDRGFATGGSTYGYRTRAVEDPSGRMINGSPALLGKRIEVVEAEAAIVRRVFELYASGLGATSIVERLNREGVQGPRGQRWRRGVLVHMLRNERYTGRLIWGQRRFERRPGSRQKVPHAVPRSEWRILDRPDLRIVDQALWERVQVRLEEVRGILPTVGRTLMRGRNAAMFSRNLFSGFMRCAVCGGSVHAVHTGHGSPRYGCGKSWQNGSSSCSNRLTIRAKIADAVMLAGLKRELLQPATVKYVADAVAAELNRLIDDRPARQEAAQAARDDVAQRLQRLVAAIESGISAATVAPVITERQRELERLDAELDSLQEPLHQRLAVIPAWVEQQLQDTAGVLGETPERTKAEFRRLGLQVTMEPVYAAPKGFYRAHASAALPCLAGTRDTQKSAVTVGSTARAAAARS
jgi:site-specific DNA recombinase